jgi:hypothetical protein
MKKDLDKEIQEKRNSCGTSDLAFRNGQEQVKEFGKRKRFSKGKFRKLDELRKLLAGISPPALTPFPSKKQMKIFRHVLFHEWLHVLLLKSKIIFQEMWKSWGWDEDLVTYLENYFAYREKVEERLRKRLRIAKSYKKISQIWFKVGKDFRK